MLYQGIARVDLSLRLDRAATAKTQVVSGVTPRLLGLSDPAACFELGLSPRLPFHLIGRALREPARDQRYAPAKALNCRPVARRRLLGGRPAAVRLRQGPELRAEPVDVIPRAARPVVPGRVTDSDPDHAHLRGEHRKVYQCIEFVP